MFEGAHPLIAAFVAEWKSSNPSSDEAIGYINAEDGPLV